MFLPQMYITRCYIYYFRCQAWSAFRYAVHILIILKDKYSAPRRSSCWSLDLLKRDYVFAMMMTSLCYEYWQFVLTQGVLMGIAIGLLQFPAFAAVSQYFDKKRAAALGVVVSGSSIGGVAIPIALSKMLNSSSLGFGWSVRVIGFV